jgi:hypothetical protein
MQTTKSIPPVLERYGIQIGERRDTESQKNIKKIQAKTCGIFIRHTFYPIELKIDVLP